MKLKLKPQALETFSPVFIMLATFAAEVHCVLLTLNIIYPKSLAVHVTNDIIVLMCHADAIPSVVMNGCHNMKGAGK